MGECDTYRPGGPITKIFHRSKSLAAHNAASKRPLHALTAFKVPPRFSSALSRQFPPLPLPVSSSLLRSFFFYFFFLPHVCFCGSQQTCQPVSPPCVFSPPLSLSVSSPLLSFFTLPSLLSAKRRTHACALSLSLSLFLSRMQPHADKTRRQTRSLASRRLEYILAAPSRSHSLAGRTHPAPRQRHTPTQGLVFKCSSEDEWAQNAECASN